MNNSKMEGTSGSRLAHFLVAAARGCFLYTKMTLDLIDRGHLKIKSSSFNVLPLTLSEIFMLEFNLKFPSSRAFDKVYKYVEMIWTFVCILFHPNLSLSEHVRVKFLK